MSKTVIGLFVVGGLTLFVGLILFMSGVSIYNTQASLKNQYEMKIKSNEAEFDNMWKQIQQSTGIAEAQKDGFRQIFNEYASSRTSPGQGRMMTWVKETIPAVNLDLYKNVMNLMSGKRDGWTQRQVEIVDIARQYNLNLAIFPKNILLKFLGFEKIDPKIVTSTRTDESFKTGKDDDVDLFKKSVNTNR